MLLGGAHGPIRLAYQAIGIVAVVRVQADADAGRHHQRAFGNGHGAASVSEQVPRQGRDAMRVGPLLQQEREFVAAKARQGVAAADPSGEALGDLVQQCAADRVAESIVDGP